MSIKSFINVLGNKIQEVTPAGRMRRMESAAFENLTHLRFGMWVKTPHGVGIVVDTDWNASPTVYVDLVNRHGHTVENRHSYALSDLRQAGWHDIPSNRRPDRDVASRMGYR